MTDQLACRTLSLSDPIFEQGEYVMAEAGARQQTTTADATTEPGVDFDVVVVGAGLAGLYMLYRLRELGLSARVFEEGDGVGGTWYWNRYPGARCDTESMEYSYSFSDAMVQEWHWTERYPAQPEILRYINHVADRFDLRRDIQFETRVTAATYDDANQRWLVETDHDDRFSAQFLVMGTGCLSAPLAPEIPGRETFAGVSLYSEGRFAVCTEHGAETLACDPLFDGASTD